MMKRLHLKKKTQEEKLSKYDNFPEIPLNNQNGRYRRQLPSNLITTTKYSLLTFIPKNLYEQFRRMTNCYFLLIVLITFIPSISPLSPWTSILPLSFVLSITALKEAFEDIRRWKADNTVNNKQYEVIKGDGSRTKKRSKNLKAGDIVRIKNDQFLPADIVPLKTALDDGICFIETAQLDGETNLKIFKAHPGVSKHSESEIYKLNGFIKPQKPTHQLYEWTGNVEVDGTTYPLNQDNLLLRGAKLRNTAWVIGVVVYTGKITKLSLNQKLPPSKFSTVERRLNKCVVAIFLFKMFCVTVITISSIVFHSSNAANNAFYLNLEGSVLFRATKDFFGYFALLSFMIPMSLMVTLEGVKVFQGKYMEWDQWMASDRKNIEETGMNTKTTNLNDELALVKYIFSDKTGTLTQNKMDFIKVSVNGTVYDQAGEGELLSAIEAGENVSQIDDFLVNLSVCQSVVPEERDDGTMLYKAQSPDEEALCTGSATNGYTFKNRTQQEIMVDIRGEMKTFELLNEIEFSSERAKMSVIARHPDGSIRVFSKGADSKMMEIMGDIDPDLRQKTFDDIENFSGEGLRTLILGQRILSEPEYEEIEKALHTANTFVGEKAERQELLKKAYALVEKDMELLGCTAIEDKLQDDVPETIHNLLRANIKVWMITGDKRETAKNIGYSCRLLKKNMHLLELICDTEEQCGSALKGYVSNYVDKPSEQPLAVLVDGHTLESALTDHKDNFLKLTSKCHSVVCCRVSPLQKAQVVKLMKEFTHEVCLSIGDGANDVSMIQEAHIGVGIFGKEGTQAARSSDYAIQEFRHLRRLLTVHGRYSYIRNSGLIQYSIYKNAAAFLVQFWFAFFCGYSATTIYDEWVVTFFNIFFTASPPFNYAIFEKDISEEIIEEYPETYKYVQAGNLFTYSSLFTWMLDAIWQSLVFFFAGSILLSNEPLVSSGHTFGMRLMGNMVSSWVITTVLLKMTFFMNTWNIVVFLGVFGNMVCYWFLFFVQSIFPSVFPLQYQMFFYVLGNPNFWVMFLLVVIVCMTPDVFSNYLKRQFYPEDWMILQEAEEYRNIDNLKQDLRAVEKARSKKIEDDEGSHPNHVDSPPTVNESDNE